MSGSSERDSAVELVLEGLDDWLRLLNLPPGANYGVAQLEQIRARIVEDSDNMRPLLLHGNIWGHMGSFLDSAVPHYESAMPTSKEPEERATQWQAAHREIDRWNREFSLATIKVGTGLIQWCRDHGGIDVRPERCVNEWMNFARRSLDSPYKPLDPVNIETLEHNMRFMQRTEQCDGPNRSPSEGSR